MTKEVTDGARTVLPVLEFPEAQLDHTATFHGYVTRFFKDSDSNAIQIAVHQDNGRVVNTWGNAANESLSFTACDAASRPAVLTWGSSKATVFSRGKIKCLQYVLQSESEALNIGLFLLGSMRRERDFQSLHPHLFPVTSRLPADDELRELLQNIERLPERVRARHLELLNAKTCLDLEGRTLPQLRLFSGGTARADQMTVDGKNQLALELAVDPAEAVMNVSENSIAIRSCRGKPLLLTVKVATDSPSLTPVARAEIFTRSFLDFCELNRVRRRQSLQMRRLERQLNSAELLSYQEKLLTGLPNFATYFGRDAMMAALMMEPVWSYAMVELVIASVLRKLKPTGEVSHEEGVGHQAIRENAAEYNTLVQACLDDARQQMAGGVDGRLSAAERVLANLQKETENYRMVDDDFQLPVLASRYLSRSDVSTDRKREFLLSPSRSGGRASRLSMLLRNLVYVAERSRSYVEAPVAQNLISIHQYDDEHLFSGSWRDSGPGYANGHFAMDVNVIWVPCALRSLERILAALSQIGFSVEDLQSFTPGMPGTKFFAYALDPQKLSHAVEVWEKAVRFFEIQISPEDANLRIHRKLRWLPKDERAYWTKKINAGTSGTEGINFLALALDEEGLPIPVANSDISTWFFLNNLTARILNGELDVAEVVERLSIFVKPYPAGLFIEGVGPVVANDAYASLQVWQGFQRDPYHSPRTVWGREVNLLLLGLAKQILAAFDSCGQIKEPCLMRYVRALLTVLDKILSAVESSGLRDNELWSYSIAAGELAPARYATSSDIQLWNLADLAVQYLLEQVSRLKIKS